MAKPIIGYQNLLEEIPSGISVSDALSGFEKELAYNWRTFDGWQAATPGVSYYTIDLGAPTNVDYWGAASHTLGTNGGSIKLQYDDNALFTSPTDFDVAVTPSDDTTMMQYVTAPISAQFWRWEITSTPTSFFGVLSLGNALEFVRAVRVGFALPREARMNKIMNNKSEGGEFLGRSVIRKGFKSNFKIELQTLDYARGVWHDFVDHAELKPFFFSWNTDYDDAVYAWMDKDVSPTTFDRNNTVQMGLNLKGLI